jgi:hypothetical protein
MDERAREDFKLRFIKLTLLLNAVILLIAIGAFILVFFRGSPVGIAAGLGLLAAGIMLYLYFSRFYQQTKEWLEVNAGTGPEKH